MTNPTTPLTLTLNFETDWHIGDGAGASGHIDRIVRRHPEDDLPYVPAKTLTGILRDACERVAQGLDDGQDQGPWQRFTATLFGVESKGTENTGHTTPARVFIGPARYAEPLRQALVSQPELRSELTFIKPGVKLDAHGLAQAKMLRLEEVALAGSVLHAQVTLDESVADLPAVHALLAAGARAADRLGGKRRRGNGRCAMFFQGLNADFSAVFNAPPPVMASTPPALGQTALSRVDTTALAAETGWHVIQLDLELQSPVVIPADTVGNVIGSYDYIPGSLLLPALNKPLRTLLGAVVDTHFTAHLAAGRIQIRNAYPLDRDARWLPSPAGLMAEKDNPSRLRNELRNSEHDGIQRKQLRGGFLAPEGVYRGEGESPEHKVAKLALTHAVIEDDRQRPTAEVGGVYTYEALAPGQRFAAEIHIAKCVLPQLPALDSLNRKLRIGRAKKDDYGLVAAKASLRTHRAPQPGEDGLFTLWLAAPLLARDARLRYINDAESLRAHVQALLDLDELELKKAFVRGHRDEGWNNAWGEPRPSRFGLAAGSCFLFRAAPALTSAQLARLEAEGLGERRGEGYGEIRLNAPLLGISLPVLSDTQQANKTGASGIDLTDSGGAFARQLQERAWRTALRRQALAQTADFIASLKWADKVPGNSQLGALRSQFEHWKDKEAFNHWLGHRNQTPNRQNKWTQASRNELQRWADQPERVWEIISPDALPSLSPALTATLKRDMAAEATRIFWLTVIGLELDKRAQADKNRTAPQQEAR